MPMPIDKSENDASPGLTPQTGPGSLTHRIRSERGGPCGRAASLSRLAPVLYGPEIAVYPATEDRFDDVVAVLGCGPTSPCCCQYWRMSSGDYGRSTLDARRAALRAQTRETPPPGMLAYVDDEPAGWCGFGVRQRMERLVRSRTIPAVDDLPVWSVFCFTVRTGYRRRGLARALLAGLIAYAREQGAPALEAYPVDTHGARIHGTAAYVGTAGMFEDAGFRRIVETNARSARLPRWLMRLDLRGTAL